MKTIVKFTLLLLALVQFHTATAQLVANAGNDTTVCSGATVILGGNPTASGGTPPYSYTWSTGAMTENITIMTFTTPTSTAYTLTVTDGVGTQAFDSVIVTVNPNPVIDSFSLGNNVSCFGGNDGTVCVNTSGGVQPYTFIWSTISVGQCHTNLSAGNYTVTVDDANGCAAVEAFTVNEPSPLEITYISENILCNGDATGRIDITVTGGVLPYSFDWSNAENTEDPNGGNPSLPAGIYSVTVTDANGCIAIETITVNEPTALIIDSIVTTDISCFGGNDGTACIYSSGGTPFSPQVLPTPYSYFWSIGTEDSCQQNLPTGTYQITINDANGCTATSIFSIVEPSELTAHIVSSTGGIAPDTLIVSVLGGTPPYSYQWSDGSTTETVINYCYTSGFYQVTIIDNKQCDAISNIIDVQDTCINSCVWPGDADNNGIVDNNDLLPVGLAYGETEFSRCNIRNNWKAIYSQDWADTLPSGTNYKHIDCNGNGIINADDTLAIIQNFGLTHSKNKSQSEWRMNAPALFVDLIPDTVLAGETLVANLILGDINIPANDVYGLAFTINYNATVVDSTQTSVAFGSSWLGTASEKISIAKDIPQNGEIKCAVTRIDKNTRSGLGIIGQASFIITTDNINGKNELAYTDMKVWISDLTVIDNQGQILEINEGSDSTQVGFEPVSVTEKPLSLNELIIQPNPATNEVFISVSDNLLSGTLTVIDTEGKIVFSKTITTHANKIHTINFANGVYFVKVISEKGVLMKRLAIVK